MLQKFNQLIKAKIHHEQQRMHNKSEMSATKIYYKYI